LKGDLFLNKKTSLQIFLHIGFLEFGLGSIKKVNLFLVSQALMMRQFLSMMGLQKAKTNGNMKDRVP
jgi:hypothetical protein